ncbi:MAG: sensor histidine kinase, partial [Terriglobales bacterium]
ARTVQTHPEHSLVSYQLFDKAGHLLESHYPPGIPVLFQNEHEVTDHGMTIRTRMTLLKEKENVIGYLQAQLPTKSRDDAVRELALITAVVAPVVLLGLSWSSYLVSEKATLQTRKTLALLRQFIADVSHELYTPLSIVQAAHESMAKLLSQKDVGAQEFQVSETALERMEHMLEDLMLLSSMETPEPDRKMQRVELDEVLQGTINEFRPKFEHKGVSLTDSLCGETHIYGDPAALQRMFANIIENAWRYTDAPGTVNVRMERDGNHVKIAVSDSGIGIPGDNLPNIFNRFYRVDSSRSRSSGGSGLGLAIAQAIAQAHKGAIEVESEPGKGSTFRVILPV